MLKKEAKKLAKIKPGVFVFGETEGATSTASYLRSINSTFNDAAPLFTLDPHSPLPITDWGISIPKTPINQGGYEMFSSVKNELSSHTPQPFTVSTIALRQKTIFFRYIEKF